MSPRPCHITAKDNFEVKHDHFLLNGQRLESLKGCKFEDGVHFSIPVGESSPHPVVDSAPHPVVDSAPLMPSRPAAVEQVVYQQHGELQNELGDIQAMIDLGRQVLNLPPWLAITLVAAFMFQRWQKQKGQQPSTCTGHAALSTQVQALEAKVQKMEQQDNAVNNVLKLMQPQQPAQKPAEEKSTTSA